MYFTSFWCKNQTKEETTWRSWDNHINKIRTTWVDRARASCPSSYPYWIPEFSDVSLVILLYYQLFLVTVFYMMIILADEVNNFLHHSEIWFLNKICDYWSVKHKRRTLATMTVTEYGIRVNCREILAALQVKYMPMLCLDVCKECIMY